MRKSHKTKVKRNRRQQKAALKFGKKAKPTHKLKSGRTGSAFSKSIREKSVRA